MNRFDHLELDLDGRTLIEASAGTGKTYAIACLYVRLVLEKGLLPDRILVVTFTEAATKELKERIRSRLRETRSVFAGDVTDDPFLLGLLKKLPERQVALARLDDALKCFDLAAILTIHGFCLRILQENAFESGSLYDTKLVTEQTQLLQEVVDDFWRIAFFRGEAQLLRYALAKKCTPDSLLVFLRKVLSNHKAEILPHYQEPQIVALDEYCQTQFQAIKAGWVSGRSAIEEIFLSDKGLSRALDSYRLDQIPQLLHGLDSFVSGENPFDLFPGFDKFCHSTIAEKTKKKFTPPLHPFFDLCDGLACGVAERLLALKSSLVDFARVTIPRKKQELNIRFFDDLLVDLYQALQREGGERLAAGIRGRYHAALIDEFQDTDPLQYDIFCLIYRDRNFPLFLIGDPKQAIYSFRGADIFSYLEASHDVSPERRYTQDTNWRSTPGLLQACNLIFQQNNCPFVFPGIEYQTVKAGGKDITERFQLAEGDPAALQLWFVPCPEGKKTIDIGVAMEQLPGSVAGEIARLLQDGCEGKAMVEGRPIRPADIAVLVRSHRQARLIQDALHNLRIPSVLQGSETIFVSDEARDLFRLLQAIAEPNDEIKARTALVTVILGKTGNEVAKFQEDGALWDSWLEKFREYRWLWQELGFLPMARRVLSKEEVHGRLLALAGGERRLTNLLHCLELTHQASLELRLGMEGTVNWLGERICDETERDEYQLRLETDDEAVRIVTIHVSKGLEYPVVFAPFSWGGVKDEGEVVAFHDRFRMFMDFGSPDQAKHRSQSRREMLAENIRLLYVALTRAKYRCYLVWGKFRQAESSPLAYLLYGPSDHDKSDPVEVTANSVASLPDHLLENRLQQLVKLGEGSLAVNYLPEGNDAPLYSARGEGVELFYRPFAGRIDTDWRVTSFTAFVAGSEHASELPDRDEMPTGTDLTVPLPLMGADAGELTIFNFPRGAQAGLFFHEIFEKIDYAKFDRQSIAQQVEAALKSYGFGLHWLPVVCRMVENVLHAPLMADRNYFSLAGLEAASWLAELEFFFPLRFLSSMKLAELFRRWNGTSLQVDPLQLAERLRFAPVKGMVRGFMDMVFRHGGKYYLVDWKSNYLGSNPDDYNPVFLRAEMERKLYSLQYLIYTVALHRYLSRRVIEYDYNRHFGGVLYIFIRGVNKDGEGNTGIFRDLPPLELIDELAACMMESGGDQLWS